VVESTDFVTIRSERAAFSECLVAPGEPVKNNQLLASITDPYTADLLQEIRASENGIVAFAHNEILIYQNAAVFKIIRDIDN
jgi:predicted deacylase